MVVSGGSASTVLAPWWRRVVAELIDLTVVAVIANLLLLVVGQRLWWQGGDKLDSLDILARDVTTVLAALAYYPVVVVRTKGQTVGKGMLKIRVVKADGRTIRLRDAVWREVVLKFVVIEGLALLPVVGSGVSELAFLADSLWPLWDRENRAIHDMLAQSRVVRSDGLFLRL